MPLFLTREYDMEARGERRGEERFQPSSAAACQFVSPVVEDFGPAKLKNVSQSGVGLLLSNNVEPGELLTITLANPMKGFAKTVLVRVAHAQSHSAGCTVGGNFVTPLTYEELTALVM
jgi:hypothetical protein